MYILIGYPGEVLTKEICQVFEERNLYYELFDVSDEKNRYFSTLVETEYLPYVIYKNELTKEERNFYLDDSVIKNVRVVDIELCKQNLIKFIRQNEKM